MPVPSMLSAAYPLSRVFGAVTCMPSRVWIANPNTGFVDRLLGAVRAAGT